ncbi:MAG: hypothetical protein MIO92_05245 [Methanosarcinaceae archaeon]|nr:hypothetical protein [Methanosarcinaceae archaeon]
MAISGFTPFRGYDLGGFGAFNDAMQQLRDKWDADKAYKQIQALKGQAFEPQQALTDEDMPALAKNAEMRVLANLPYSEEELKMGTDRKPDPAKLPAAIKEWEGLQKMKAMSGQNIPIGEAWAKTENLKNKYQRLKLTNPFTPYLQAEMEGEGETGKGKGGGKDLTASILESLRKTAVEFEHTKSPYSKFAATAYNIVAINGYNSYSRSLINKLLKDYKEKYKTDLTDVWDRTANPSARKKQEEKRIKNMGFE